jgi:hypothetical protein
MSYIPNANSSSYRNVFVILKELNGALCRLVAIVVTMTTAKN